MLRICISLRTCQVIGEISVAGATYKTMEFVGTAVESLTVKFVEFSFEVIELYCSELLISLCFTYDKRWKRE